jgi:predicted PurR-regulated permease PerM
MTEHSSVERYVEAAIRIGLVGLLAVWSFRIIRPFLEPVLWGVIIAVGFYPLHRKLASVLGNRKKLSAAVLTLFSLALLLVPAALLTDSAINGIQTLKGGIESGTLSMPQPSEKVARWPVVGKSIDRFWRQASENMQSAMQKFAPFIKKYGKNLLAAFMSLGLTIVQFVISIVIAGVLLVKADAGGKAAQRLFRRLAGDQGESLAVLAGATIRSVVQGLLGIAVIQGLLAAAGLVAAGVPAAGFWALVVMFLAVIQIPPILVLGPIAVYVFSIHAITPAILFLLWSILVSVSDNILKPFLLGRGVAVPMLVVLLGAIGGMIMSGIIGMFIGPVVLSISYTIFIAWIDNETDRLAQAETPTPEHRFGESQG